MGIVQQDMSVDVDLLDTIRHAAIEEICGETVHDLSMGEIVRAGLMVTVGGLDDAHRIVQRFETPEAWYWHGLVHRREPDWSNAAYWFRRVGHHPVFDELGTSGLASTLPDRMAFDRFVKEGRWDPFTFVALCRACAEGEAPTLREAVEAVQREEIVRLLQYCLRRAKTSELR